MSINPTGGANQNSGAYFPPGMTPEKVLGVLSQVFVDGKPIVPPEAQGNPKEMFLYITKYFSTNHGIPAKDLPHVAEEILRGAKQGSISWKG